MLKKNKKISVIVPVYNEMGNIAAFHKQLITTLTKFKSPFEIIYMDDRSTDGTFEYLKKLSHNVKSHKVIKHGLEDFQLDDLKTQKSSDKSLVDRRHKLKDETVLVFEKEGEQGKSFSLMEGFEKATGDVFVMIDGDLQYPPDKIPQMVEQLKKADIVIANRKQYKDSLLRRTLSTVFRFGFGSLLFGLKTDIQSGLKAFTREVFETIKFTPASAWTFDLEFLYRARTAGFAIANIDITFSQRNEGESKVSVSKTSLEIGLNALAVKAKKILPLSIPPTEAHAMKGAGIGYNKHKYITHTTLPFSLSATKTFSFSQLVFISLLISMLIAGLMVWPLRTLQISVALLSILYFIDTVFNLLIVLRSLKKPEDIRISKSELYKLSDEKLPVYTILCPLYKEAHVVPQFVDAIEKLDWPKDKLDVMLLLEDDDQETVAIIRQMDLPSFVRIVVVPHSLPKTKPKACNYGLAFARGEYLVIFDAEDIPDPLQLKKVYIGFQKVPDNVQCLQAKLNFYNSGQNLLTRFFTVEYSLWFDLTLTGLQSLRSTIPLGGTSNHFRTQSLKDLEGWDPFNVTEDADLGIRLFKRGYETAIIDSTTLEEATSNVRNWLRQRSRWLKGYMQTYLVHMRNSRSFIEKKGFGHYLIFQLTVGGKLLFILLNPLMWVLTALYFFANSVVGSWIELIYVPPISYLAVFSWIFGNFLFLYYYMLGAAKRNQWDLMKYVLVIPLYWVLMSTAAMIGLYQLIFKPHYWEKTLHGFHLASPKPQAKVGAKAIQPVVEPAYVENFGEARPVRVRPSFTSQVPYLVHSLSIVFLLTCDLLFAFYYLPTESLRDYVLLSLIGKTLFFLSQIGGMKLTSLFSRSKKPEVRFSNAIFFTFLVGWIGFVVFGIEASLVFPLFSGTMFNEIFDYLPFYTFAFMCFAIANVFVGNAVRKKNMTFVWLSLLIVASQIGFFMVRHDGIGDFVRVLAFSGTFQLVSMVLLQGNADLVTFLSKKQLRTRKKELAANAWATKRMNILILNWRDTKHVHAGGAEVYIHELAKRWAASGNTVTLFCGNDRNNVDEEVMDGVEIIRRGGTYLVYLYAVLHYLFKFSGKYDVIIDSENGIPFFSPLFSRKPVMLLVHHVHQQIFRVFLKFPFNVIAAFLEGKLMPIVYKNKAVITVSESSKKEILKLGFTHEENITIIPNGVTQPTTFLYPKTTHPSFVYIGRLKAYKQIDVAIRAFARVVDVHQTATFTIAGAGESEYELKELVGKLKLENNVIFAGRVTEDEKIKLLSESWIAIQPSQMEGWGITVIEANAHGTPVIASQVNGLRDSVIDGKTGILAESGNVRQFAIAMNMLVMNGEWRNRLAQEAYIWSLNFNWQESADAFYSLIGDSLEKRSTIPAYQDISISNAGNS